ncbi:hypothetical protein OG365_01350 [Streptomyces sp. NBC_00853]|uniref:hypothetical protein n=1 Tax=Streptomyces sp. NBC_00853 TaxID=2903681 RepID=UPI003872E17A|nr:hypothetical protein OG365_01350 [Streptomyces sp. NBC_00853]
MIDISFLPHPGLDLTGTTDAGSVSEQMLRFGSFNYGLKFEVDGKEFLSGRGKDPILDFMLYIAHSVPRVRAGESATLEIFSTTYWIRIAPQAQGSVVLITDSYGKDTAQCAVAEYFTAALDFLRAALDYLTSRHPSLEGHVLLERIRNAAGL